MPLFSKQEFVTLVKSLLPDLRENGLGNAETGLSKRSDCIIVERTHLELARLLQQRVDAGPLVVFGDLRLGVFG